MFLLIKASLKEKLYTQRSEFVLGSHEAIPKCWLSPALLFLLTMLLTLLEP
jgi:hypothetical protein